MKIGSNKELLRFKKLIKKSGLFDEVYYKNQFKSLPDCDLMEYFIENGENENKSPSPYFDLPFYLGENPDVKQAGMNPLIHYILFGEREGRLCLKKDDSVASLYERWCDNHRHIKPINKFFYDLRDVLVISTSGQFSGAWYLEKYADANNYITKKKTWKWRFSKNPLLRVAAKFTTTPILYYVKYGMYRGQNPNEDFSTEYYMNHNSDLIHGKSITPFIHYIKHGKKEGRICNYARGSYKTLKEIYNQEFKKKTVINTNILSIITEAKIEKSDNIEVIPYKTDINSCIKNTSGNIVWINKSGNNAESIDEALDMFRDESVFAVVLKNDESDYDILGYYDFVNDEHILSQKFKYSSVLFRKPSDDVLAELDFNDEIGFNESILKICAGAKIGTYTKVYFDKHYDEDITDEYIGRISKVLTDKYFISREYGYKFYSKLRLDLSNKYGIKKFADMFKPSDYIKDAKPNIMIGVYGFTFGGGEIMPIRLANKLYEMGYTVVLHAYSNTSDQRVRNMLNANIPVVYTDDPDTLYTLVDKLNIQVIHSHHQAVQSLVSDTYTKYPQLKGKVLNIGTSHGMYEDFDEQTLDYIFNNTELINNTDYWTYVADKNIIPFEKYNVYDEQKFIKIPNGMDRPAPNKIDLAEYGVKKNSFTIAIISRAIIEKGWLHGIEAVKKARDITGKDIHLLLVGDGEVYEKYRDAKSCEYIHFLGFRDNPCDYLSSVDLCMLPSYYASESAPLCLIEAMMCSKPSIASDIGDVRYILDYNGELAGSIFPLDNMSVNDDVLADAIVKMVSDKDYYNKCREAAINRASYFELSNIASMYIDLYNKAIEQTENDYTAQKAEKINNLLISGEDGTGPLVSVIVPNYNHSKYLPMRLDCIFNQTYKNIKVLLMDDCSTDNSREILHKYAEMYPDKAIELFNETNSGGVFYQWTKGIRNSEGEICWIAESDDFCEITFLENILPAFEDEDVKISYCQYVFTDENNNHNDYGFFNYMGTIDENKWHKNYINDSLNEVSTALGIKNTIPNASGAVFRNPGDLDLFDDPSWYKMKICGDWIFYLHLLQNGKVAYTVDTKSYFRFHSNNSSAKTYSTDVYYLEHNMVAKCIRSLFAPENDALKLNYDVIKRFYFNNVPDGTEEKFEKLYSLSDVLTWSSNIVLSNIRIKKQTEKLINKDADYKTVVINPVMSATDDPNVSLEDKMNFVGANSGNMVFTDAVREQTNPVDVIWFNGDKFENDRKKYGNVTAVIPSSNFIIKGSDNVIKGMNNMYMHSEGNITMIGLGAQASAEDNTPRKLVNVISDDAKKFFKMAADRCVSLGIRGEFTAECLELMGIRNYRIIGCPTYYKHLNAAYKKLKEPDMTKPIFNITGKSKFETKLLQLGIQSNATWLIQMMTELPQLMENRTVDEAVFKSSYPDLDMTQEELGQFMRTNGKLFFNMDKWNDFMRTEDFSFSFGSRFHGNMSALRNGIPALWITHDSRTTELIDVLKLPHISISKLNDIEQAEQLLEYCDYSDFARNYEYLVKEYIAFLNENHIDHKFSF